MKRAIYVVFLTVLLIFICASPLSAAITDTDALSTVFVSGGGSDSAAGTLQSPYKTLYRAFTALPFGGCAVVIDEISIDEILALPTSNGLITVTSVYGGVDYRLSANGGAILQLSSRIETASPIKFENISFNTNVENLVIACEGNYTVFGSGITLTHSSGISNNLSITAGGNDRCDRRGGYIEINSGNWYRIRGGNRSGGTVSGDTFIKFNGGSVASTFEGGGVGAGSGDIYIMITGGSFASDVCGTASASVTGNVYMLISGGTFSSVVCPTNTGALFGNAYVYVSGGSFVGGITTSGRAIVSGSKIIKYISGTTRPSSYGFSVYSTTEDNFNTEIAPYITAFGNAAVSFIGGADSALTPYLERLYVAGGGSIAQTAASISTEKTVVGAVHNVWENIPISVKVKNNSPFATNILISSISDRVVFDLPEILPLEPGEQRTVSLQGQAQFKGDTNRDGRISLRDTLALLKALAYGVTLPAYVGDYNCDGYVNSLDALALLFAINNRDDIDDENRLTSAEVSDLISVEVPQSGHVFDSFGGTPSYAGGILSGDVNSYAFMQAQSASYKLSGKVKIPQNGVAGVYFSANAQGGIKSLNGYYFELNHAVQSITAYLVNGGRQVKYGERKIPFNADEWYDFELLYDGGFTEIYFNNNKLDTEPYPKFNFDFPSKGNAIGFFMPSSSVMFGDISLNEYHRNLAANASYTNPIFPGMTDPEVYFENGVYYIYGAVSSRGVNAGVYCYTTTDFKTFNDEGLCLAKANVYGDLTFKAANIVKYGETYYMFYMTYVNSLGTSVTAYATASSPKGPFTGDTTRALTEYDDFIGGQPFIDSDGQPYITYVRTTGGNILWVAKLNLSGSSASVDFSSAQIALEPTEEWENAKAAVVECGYIINHNGYYYMLYSGGNYNSAYGMGYATAPSPLGPYTKYEYNPIFKGTDAAYGVGGVTIFTDSTGQHYMMYLKNNAPTFARPLASGIDKIKFVANPQGGRDIIEAYCPTVTPMPLPVCGSIADYQRTRFCW